MFFLMVGLNPPHPSCWFRKFPWCIFNAGILPPILVGLFYRILIFTLSCRSFSETVQTGFACCKFVSKFSTCWANYAICKLYSCLSPNTTTNPSTSYVVLLMILVMILLCADKLYHQNMFLMNAAGMHGTWLPSSAFLNFLH
jgi:hypothetical protein